MQFAIVAAAAFSLTSPDVHQGKAIAKAQLFNSFGCKGDNISPALEWRGAPAGAKSFALTVYDPDAPTGSGWWHWIVFNIPANVGKLEAGAGSTKPDALPAGAVQSNTDFGKPGYGGPCPPQGDKPHRYVFTVFALDVDKLDLPPSSMGALVGFNLRGHTIAKATLTATYGR
jgi:Raf kinase inhibitor-like YbhB/YbcL family protein